MNTDDQISKDVAFLKNNLSEMRTAQSKRRRALLSKPANRRVYEDTGIAIHLAKELNRARRKAKLTQSELAKRMGTSQAHLSRVESGNVGMKMETFVNYASACGLKLKIRLVPFP